MNIIFLQNIVTHYMAFHLWHAENVLHWKATSLSCSSVVWCLQRKKTISRVLLFLRIKNEFPVALRFIFISVLQSQDNVTTVQSPPEAILYCWLIVSSFLLHWLSTQSSRLLELYFNYAVDMINMIKKLAAHSRTSELLITFSNE